MKFFGNSKYRRAVINVHKILGGGGRGRGVAEMTFWLVHASYSLLNDKL